MFITLVPDRHGSHHQQPKLQLQVQPRHRPQQLELQPVRRRRHRRRRRHDAVVVRRSESVETGGMVFVDKNVDRVYVEKRHFDVDGYCRQRQR
jgi:hypothetical protein